MAINPVSISASALTAFKDAAAAKSLAAASGTTAAAASATTGSSATDTFEKVLSSLSQSQNQSDGLVQDLASGGSVDLHQVMIGLEENDINFRVTMAIRDKLVSAYQDVMKMQI